MQRRKSKSVKKTSKKVCDIKNECYVCQIGGGVVTQIQRALFKKYSSQHYSYLEQINISIKKPQECQSQKQYLQKYYKAVQRKHQFHQVKEIYKLHVQSPRLFLPEIRDIIIKCHHRKRLLEYFRIAKVLGLKVESVKFSTFLFSVSKSFNPNLQKKSYDRLIGQISQYQFSEEIQKQLLETLEGKSGKNLSPDRSMKKSQNMRLAQDKDKKQGNDESFVVKISEESTANKEKSKLKIVIDGQGDSVSPFYKTIKKIRKQPRSIGSAFLVKAQLDYQNSCNNTASDMVPQNLKKVMTKKRSQNKITPSPTLSIAANTSKQSVKVSSQCVNLKNSLKNNSLKKQQNSSTAKKIPTFQNSKKPNPRYRGSLTSRGY